jgi:hypothetical protein
MISTPIVLGNNKFAYIDTDETNLCFDQRRQYYFGIIAEELNGCKAVDSQIRIYNRNIHYYQAMNKESNCCSIEEKSQTFATPDWCN